VTFPNYLGTQSARQKLAVNPRQKESDGYGESLQRFVSLHW